MCDWPSVQDTAALNLLSCAAVPQSQGQLHILGQQLSSVQVYLLGVAKHPTNKYLLGIVKRPTNKCLICRQSYWALPNFPLTNAIYWALLYIQLRNAIYVGKCTGHCQTSLETMLYQQHFTWQSFTYACKKLVTEIVNLTCATLIIAAAKQLAIHQSCSIKTSTI